MILRLSAQNRRSLLHLYRQIGMSCKSSSVPHFKHFPWSKIRITNVWNWNTAAVSSCCLKWSVRTEDYTGTIRSRLCRIKLPLSISIKRGTCRASDSSSRCKSVHVDKAGLTVLKISGRQMSDPIGYPINRRQNVCDTQRIVTECELEPFQPNYCCHRLLICPPIRENK